MKLEAWTPTFNPTKGSPIVPIWVVKPELPWNFYYMEILIGLLSPVGTILHFDLASFQKIRKSVVKVKVEFDLTRSRPHHVWLGFDDNHDDNGEGKWLEI